MKFSPKKSVHALSLTALVLMAVLAGCSSEADGNPELEETTDASSPEPTEYVPASAEGPAQNVPEPRLRASATEASEEGALETLEYFWEAAQYTRLTGDSTHIGLVSSDNCEFCNTFMTDWRDAYDSGNWAVPDGEVNYEISEAWSANEEDGTLSVDVLFSLTEPDIKLYASSGRIEQDGENVDEESSWFALMLYDSTSQRWEVEWIGLEELVTWDE